MDKRFGKNTDTANFSIPFVYAAGRRLANTSVRAHAHDFTELILVTQGECLVKIEEKSGSHTGEKNLVVAPCDLLVIPPHLSHTQIEKGYVGTSYIGFQHKQGAFNCKFRVISLKNDLHVARWIDDIIDLHDTIHNNDLYSEVAAILLQAIAVRIEQIEHRQEHTLLIHPSVQKAVDMIHSRLTETISVDEISEYVNMSTSYLTKLFKKDIGCGMIQYQQQQRMHLARRHLLNPYITVSQVAHKCGYDNINFFIRLFRKNFKTSPGKWRQNLQKL